jgi:hypothetical protein
MQIIVNRIKKLRYELNNLSSNREKLNFIQNYYLNKRVIIVGTGPKFTDNIEKIKKNIDENTILICIKQSIKYFDMMCDFHILNLDHYEKYNYDKINKPIICQIFYDKIRKNINFSNYDFDIAFYIHNINNILHERKDGWKLLNTDIDFISFNDSNLGPNENMVINKGHIFMELALPLSIHIGCKEIILNGIVGGSNHGTYINNPNDWNYLKSQGNDLYKDLEIMIENSKYFNTYFERMFGIDIYSICDTMFYFKRKNIK